MNLKQLIADGAYTVFARMNNENKIKQIESVQYIKQLASSMEVNIDDWNILELFGTGRGNVLFLDKREINKRFLENAQKVAATVVTATAQVSPEIARLHTQLNTSIKSTILNRIRQLEEDKSRRMNDASRYFAEASTRLQQVAELSANILSLKKEEVDFAGQIKAIEQAGFWKFAKFDNGILHFHMNNDLYITYVKKSANVDIRLNFGKFRAEYNPTAGWVRAHALSGNIPEHVGIPHPHLNNGTICWGAASNVITQKIAAFDVVGIMQLLANLLSDYNDGNPYRTMAQFSALVHVAEARKMQANGASSNSIRKYLQDSNLEDYMIEDFFESDEVSF